MHPPTLQFEVGVGDGVKNFRKVFAGGQKFLFILVARGEVNYWGVTEF